MAEVEQDRVHARIEQRSTTPELVHVDNKIEEGKQEEGHGSGGQDEGKGPEVLVDWDQSIVQRESGKGSGCQSKDAGPNSPPDNSGSPLLMHDKYSASSCPKPD